ncbi:MAG: DUF92 domain-containing protein [Candidatus Micrarchaeia archaeon]
MKLELMNFLTGFVLSGAMAMFIERKDVLTFGGMLTAIALGTMVYGLGGPLWMGVLFAFFISSSALTSLFEKEKEKVNREQFEKGGPRDPWQVIANGGLSSGLAAAYFLYPQPIMLAAFLGVLATVNADTWATELGVLSRRVPRLVTTLKSVERGRSGGITLLGSVASLAGALFIGGCAVVLAGIFDPTLLYAIGWEKVVIISGLSGFLGSVIDSLLGATIQAQYYCGVCKKNTEQRVHHCGTRTVLKTGFSIVDNDTVNLLASIAGGIIAALLFPLL